MGKNKCGGAEIDHEYTSEIVCPYCGHIYRDSWDQGLDEIPCEMECANEECLERFFAYIDVDVSYVTEKAD